MRCSSLSATAAPTSGPASSSTISARLLPLWLLVQVKEATYHTEDTAGKAAAVKKADNEAKRVAKKMRKDKPRQLLIFVRLGFDSRKLAA